MEDADRDSLKLQAYTSALGKNHGRQTRHKASTHLLNCVLVCRHFEAARWVLHVAKLKCISRVHLLVQIAFTQTHNKLTSKHVWCVTGANRALFVVQRSATREERSRADRHSNFLQSRSGFGLGLPAASFPPSSRPHLATPQPAPANPPSPRQEKEREREREAVDPESPLAPPARPDFSSPSLVAVAT